MDLFCGLSRVFEGRHSASRGSILDLPPEILGEIARNLCLHCRFGYQPDNLDDGHFVPSLASLGRTCRTLQQIVTPILYHRPFHRKLNVIALLRTLTHRPEYASHIKHLRTEIWDIGPCGGIPSTRETFQTINKFALACLNFPHTISPLAMRQHRAESKDVGSDVYGIIAVLLTLCCPKLEILHLETSCHPETDRHLPQPRSLGHLRELIACRSSPRVRDSGRLSNFLAAAPNLIRIELWNHDYMLPWPHMPSVREVVFAESSTDAASLASLLNACPGLEHLSYSPRIACYDMNQLLPAEFGEVVVSKSPPGLKSLAVEMKDLGWPRSAKLQSLDGMTSLRKVRLELIGLFLSPLDRYPGTDPFLDEETLVSALPSSIETAEFEIFKPSCIWSVIMAIPKAIPLKFPNLRSVGFDSLSEEAWEEARSAFGMHGVQVYQFENKRLTIVNGHLGFLPYDEVVTTWP